MNREEYENAIDRLVDRYLRPPHCQGAIAGNVDIYLRRYDALRDKFVQSQQEKADDRQRIPTSQ